METTKTRTENEQLEIEAIANIISRQSFPMTRSEIETLNDDTGWTFEIRYEPTSNNYVSDSDRTRVEGLTLDAESLEYAFTLAEEWMD